MLLQVTKVMKIREIPKENTIKLISILLKEHDMISFLQNQKDTPGTNDSYLM